MGIQPRMDRAALPACQRVTMMPGPQDAGPFRTRRIRRGKRAVPDDDAPELPMGIDPVVSRRIFLGMLALLAGAATTFSLLRAPVSPPPAAIAGDPLLVEGRETYLARCVSCHGESGRGDGPIAKGLAGPPVGDLKAAQWKHGDRPDQVLAVIAQGVRDTAMSPWKSTLSDRALHAVTAYVYHLAGRPVPPALRGPDPSRSKPPIGGCGQRRDGHKISSGWMTASASISTRAASSIRRATWTSVVAGRIDSKISPWTSPTSFQRVMSVR